MMQYEIKTVKIGQSPDTMVLQADQGFPDEISCASLAEIGGRAEQQDEVFMEYRNGFLLAAVCDGMGGMQGGALASRIASDIMRKRFSEETVTNARNFLLRSVNLMDRAICCLEVEGIPMQAGTTIVAALLEQEKLYWLSVGDSRIYLYRRGKILCPVPAHNYGLILKELMENGEITVQQYQREGNTRNADGLISYLGIDGVPRAEINERPFQTEPGDRILLCSDGLYRAMDDQEIGKILGTGLNTEEKVKLLVGTALERGGPYQDNTSAVLIERKRRISSG